MGVTRQSKINCDHIEDFGWDILQLQEEIAHKDTYTENSDTGLLKIKLEAMIEQQRENHG